MKGMFKKFLILGAFLLGVFTFVACDGMTLPTNITTPTGLTTTEGETTTGGSSTTSSTTSSTGGTVTTTTINVAAEIAAINTILDGMEADVPANFAATLVENGMTAVQFSAFLTGLMTFQAAAQMAESPLEVNTALKTFLVTPYNYEAMLSAAALMLPVQLDNQIANTTTYIAYCESQIVMYGDPYGDFARDIEDGERNIGLLQELKTFLAANEEEVVAMALNTVNYLVAFQADVDNALITSIMSLEGGPGSPTFPTIAEVILIKNEVIAVLQENIPSAANIELLFQLLVSLEVALVGETDLSTQLDLLTLEMATSVNLSMQLTLELLEAVDETLVTNVITIVESTDHPAIKVRHMLVLMVEFLGTFEEAQTTLIGQLDAVYTDAQMKALFDSFISSIDDFMALAGAPTQIIQMVTMVTAGFDYNWISGTSNVGLKLAYEFVMAMDDDFIYAVLDIVDAAEPDAIKVKEMILLVADFIGTFQTDQAALLAELAAYFPEADVEIMFNSIVASLGDFITLAGAPVEVVAMVELITANLNYQLVSGAADVVGELGYNLFNYFLTSEGGLIDLIVLQSGFEQHWNELTSEWEYSNYYTSTQYINQTEWILAQNQSMLVIIDEVFNYADAVMSDLSPADIDALVALIVGVVPESVVMEMSGLTSEQVSAFGILLGQAITNQSGNVLAFLNALIDYVIINNVLDEVGIKQAAIAAHFQDTYGPDYYNNMSWYFADDPYESLVMVIFVSGEIYDFMDVTNKGYADAVIAEVFDFIGAPAVMAYLGETTEHVDAMEVDVNEFVTDVLGYAAVIKDYDVATLGDPEMTTIGELMALIDLWLSPDTPEAPVVK